MGKNVKAKVSGIKLIIPDTEGLVEYMISHLLKKSSLAENEFVCYDLEEIKYGTVIYNGVKSPDFLGKGWQIITLERLFRNFFGESLQMRWIE